MVILLSKISYSTQISSICSTRLLALHVFVKWIIYCSSWHNLQYSSLLTCSSYFLSFLTVLKFLRYAVLICVHSICLSNWFLCFCGGVVGDMGLF